jgi:hypothetical protein
MSDERRKTHEPDAGELEALERSDQLHPWQLTADELVERMRWLRDFDLQVHEHPEGIYVTRGVRLCALPGLERGEVMPRRALDLIVLLLELDPLDLQLDLPADSD